MLFTAIASPEAIVCELKKHPSRIHTANFPDHHFFNKTDIRELGDTFNGMPGERKVIVTTEKDATRLLHLPYLEEKLKSHIYVLPIEISFLQNQQEKFNKYITDYVTKNSRNSSLSKR